TSEFLSPRAGGPVHLAPASCVTTPKLKPRLGLHCRYLPHRFYVLKQWHRATVPTKERELVERNRRQKRHKESRHTWPFRGALGRFPGRRSETESTPDVVAALADDHVRRAIPTRAGQVRRNFRP